MFVNNIAIHVNSLIKQSKSKGFRPIKQLIFDQEFGSQNAYSVTVSHIFTTANQKKGWG